MTKAVRFVVQSNYDQKLIPEPIIDRQREGEKCKRERDREREREKRDPN